MMRTALITLFVGVMCISCHETNEKSISAQKDSVAAGIVSGDVQPTEDNSSDDSEFTDFCDTLFRYFKKNEIAPVIDKTFNDGNDTATVFNAGRHRIVWKYTDSTTSVKIDDQKIDIRKKGFVGPYSIRAVRLFSINKREILAIEFYIVECGGSCFDGNTLFYDVHTKSSNFFSHVAMNCFSLYDFKKDNTIDMLVPAFEGEIQGPYYETYTLYQLNASGVFNALKDNAGNEFFVKVFYPERDPEVACEKSEMKWFEQIN